MNSENLFDRQRAGGATTRMLSQNMPQSVRTVDTMDSITSYSSMGSFRSWPFEKVERPSWNIPRRTEGPTHGYFRVVAHAVRMSAATAVRPRHISTASSAVDLRMRNNSSRGTDHGGGGSGSPLEPTTVVAPHSRSASSLSPPSSPGQAAGRPSRCCFCCLAVKSSNGGADKSRDNKLGSVTEKDEPPTLDELHMWGESFEKLMKCAGGRKLFGEFLRSEYSEENMLFYLACEDLKKERIPELIEEKARLIYEDYISILSPKEVSLDSRVREVINRNMVEPTPHTFDEAQLQIWTLMHRDSYPRFLNSQVYKRLLQQLS